MEEGLFMLKIIQMNVNFIDVQVAVDERESLLDTLRNSLNLTSVKRGCEVGECGACTVLINGKTVNTCTYLAVNADGKKILTVEGLIGKRGQLHPIQQAFIDEAAVQCGFCTPGFIMSALEIVSRDKDYTREEIMTLISGHLCRCTGYENIIKAILKVNENRKNILEHNKCIEST